MVDLLRTSWVVLLTTRIRSVGTIVEVAGVARLLPGTCLAGLTRFSSTDLLIAGAAFADRVSSVVAVEVPLGRLVAVTARAGSFAAWPFCSVGIAVLAAAGARAGLCVATRTREGSYRCSSGTVAAIASSLSREYVLPSLLVQRFLHDSQL